MKKLLLLLLFMFAGLNVFGQVMTENFEGATFPPAGWTTFETGTGSVSGPSWAETNLAAFTYGGVGKSAYMNRENVTAGLAIDWMVTSQVLVPANGQLRFYTKTIQVGVQGTLYDIKVSTVSQTNPADFTTVQSWDDATLVSANNVYEEKIVDLSAYPVNTPIYIAFVMSGDNGDRWLVDNINVVEKCNDPLGPLTVTGETTSSAILDWTSPPGVTQWQVEVVPFSDPFTNIPNQPTPNAIISSKPYTATGLLPNTLYKFQVRSLCNGVFASDWFGPKSFQTASFGDTCGGPIVVGALPYVTNDNTANYLDSNDVAQPLTCSGTATNYMQGNDVFYSFTPATTGNYIFNLAPTNAGSSIHVYTQCPVAGMPAASCLGGVANPGSTPRNIVLNGLVGGTTYYVIISSSSLNQTVGYNLTIQQAFCNQPTGLAATVTSATTADLSWVVDPGMVSWEVSYAPAPYNLPVGAGTTTTMPYQAINLVPGVVYQYYVRANCNDGNFSVWSGPFTFSTPQVATALNFTDGFETLTGWTLNNGSQSNKWAVGTGTNNGGTHALYVTDTNGDTNTYNNTATSVVHAYKDFVIPVGATQLDFTFDWRSIGENATDYFRVWTVPTTTVLTPGTQITALANSRIKIGNDFASTSNFTTQNYTLNATPYAGGNMRVVFEWRNNNAAGLQPPAAIDNIILNLVPCPKPMNPTISNINYNNAQVNWANGGSESQWEVLVLPTGSPAPTAGSVGVTASTNPFIITGLTSVTCYDVYVRAVCSPGVVSFWSTVATFCTTPHFCAGDHFYDTGGVAGDYGNSQNIATTVCPDNAGNVVTVIFNQFNLAAGDNLAIRDGSLITSPLLGNFTGATLPPSFTSTLANGGCLTFVFTSNGTGVSTGWDASMYCSTPITCPKPINLTATNVGTTSAQLNWTNGGTETQWEILVLPFGSPVPAPGTPGTAVTTNPFIWTPLTPGTAYTFFVRAICSPTAPVDASLWSNGGSFYTKPTNDDCATPLNVPVNTDMMCTVVTAGTITGATNSGVPTSTCGGTADDDTWFSFTATSAAHIINFNDIVGSTTDLSHAVYSGTCGAMTLLYCDVNNFSYNNTFVVGQTYFIRVWSATTTANQSVNFNVCINRVGPPIFAENSSTTAAPTTYTVPQLVTDVLVTSPCGIVSNITSSTGSNFGQQNGIGYFNKNGSSFGLEEGIILATRSANTCDGPNTAGSEGTGAWPGDAQLLSYMQSTGESVTSYNNSSILEFDFVPIADQIKFDFIFASDEYGTFQCSYSDAFAFFLTNLATGTTTNLAVIPGTTPPVPVAVTTIRKNEYNSSCASAHPAYFDKFYGAGTPQNGLPDVISPTNFKGYTVPMSATGTVVPGQTYHMKFVVGDRNDSSFDSAVFLSKFDIGSVDLGNDLTVNDNSALCAGQSYTINSGLTAPPYGFTWYYMAPSTSTFVEMVGQTGPTLNVTLPGQYKLVAQYIGSACVGEDTILVEFYPDLILITPEPNDLTICTANPVFDLTQNSAVVTANFANPADYQVTYYLTEQDAISGVNMIPNPTTYTNVTNPQTIWVRIYSTVTFCSGVKNFEIEVVSPPSVDITYNTTPYCFNAEVASVTITGTGTTGGTYSIVGNPANISVDSNGTVTWDNQIVPGSYTINYAVGSGACSATDSFTIVIGSPITAAFTSSNTTICGGSSSVVTLSGEPGATITYYDGTSNQTIVLDASGNATFNHTGGTTTYSLVNVILGNCTQALTGTVTVTINPTPLFTIPANLTFCAGSTNTIAVNPSNFNLNDVTYAWTFNTNPLPDTTSSIVVNQSGTYTVTVTDAQTCFSTQSCVVNSIAMPVADVLADVNACDEYVLQPLSAGNSYYTAANGLGTQLNAGDIISTSQTIYVYAQTATNPNCIDQSNFDISIVDSPEFDITGECESNQFVLTANISNPQDYSFEWTNTANVVVGTNSNILPIDAPGTYSCTITNLTGVVCQKQVSQLFDNVACQIQKGISPNGDNMNDYLELKAKKVAIFNRFGREVYTKTDYNNDWHGQFMGGGDMPDGTYYYVIEVVSGDTRTGWIYINREQK